MRIGTVPFLNAVPLTWRLQQAGLNGEVISAPPRELTSLLIDGHLDAGLIPIVDYLHGAGDAIVKNISIAAEKQTDSVLLISRVPIPEVESVAVDRGSRSSIALLQILLAERHDLHPLIKPADPDVDAMLEKADAALVIGDPALRYKPRAAYVTIDLASEWNALTGLPFVFATWVVREGVDGQSIARILLEAKKQGLCHLDEILEAEAAARNIAASVARTYLTERLQYDLTEQHVSVISKFGELCVSHGITERNRELRFVG